MVSVALGYLALLPASSHYVIMNAPEYRGVYNSAWAGTALLLSAAWIWPMLIWSRLGAQRRENGLESLLGCSPEIFRQLTAQWLSGLALTPPLPGSGQ